MPNSSIIKPKNWPDHLPYLTTSSYSPRLTPSNLGTLHTKSENAIEVPPNLTKGPCVHVKIMNIKDSSHPAFGQAGLFAARDLNPNSFILEYKGVLHVSSTDPGQEDDHTHSDYDLSLDRESGLAIDAAKMGNEARFVNDYRGIKDKPNAEFREIWDPKRKERGMAVWVLPVGKSGKGKGIKKSEEILVSYGRGFWGARTGEEDHAEDNEV